MLLLREFIAMKAYEQEISMTLSDATPLGGCITYITL